MIGKKVTGKIHGRKVMEKSHRKNSWKKSHGKKVTGKIHGRKVMEKKSEEKSHGKKSLIRVGKISHRKTSDVFGQHCWKRRNCLLQATFPFSHSVFKKLVP